MKQPTRRAVGSDVEALEGRVVLNGGGFGVFGTPTPSVQVQDARLVQQDFNTFRAAYNNDYRTILFGADSTGSVNPATNRAAFDAKVATDLATLNTSIAGHVANLSDGTALAATIQGELLGTGSNALQGDLAALPTPSGVYTSSNRLFRVDSNAAINVTDSAVIRQVRTDSSTTTTPPPTTGTTRQQAQQALAGVRSAFSTFQSTYNSDVATVLDAAGTSGSVNPATNRAAFDAKVATDLSTLNASVTAALSALPSSTALVTAAQTAINGGPGSLQANLTSIATPAATGSSLRLFHLESNAAINVAFGTIQADTFRTVVTSIDRF